MTITDVRILYKKDTGQYPLYNRIYDFFTKSKTPGTKKMLIFKSVKQGNDYGKWLEEQISNLKDLQESYYKETYELPSTLFLSSNVEHELYYFEYIFWLEEKFLKKLNND